MAYNWFSIFGEFVQEDKTIVFKGGKSTLDDVNVVYEVGNFICDQNFGGGIITGEVEFVDSVKNGACGYILYYQPSTKAFIDVSLGVGDTLCSIRTWTGDKWVAHAATGNRTQLVANRPYRLSVLVRGSSVKITIDGVDVLATNLQYPIPLGQAGIWCLGEHDIKIRNYKVSSEEANIFVVMQFTSPFDELYKDVILPVCNDLGFVALRADETYGPGLIISDIARKIIEAKIIIAEITPENSNVYYEVGYAHALNKPTILIAEKSTQLPFDVSPFRVLFYENTIGGKAKVEANLRKHLEAIQQAQPI